MRAQSWQGTGRGWGRAVSDRRPRRRRPVVDAPPYPQPLVELAGTRRVLATTHKLIGQAWEDEGTTREQRTWVADPDLIRRL